MSERLVQVAVECPDGTSALFEFWLNADGLVRGHGTPGIAAASSIELVNQAPLPGPACRARVQVWP